jgi:excisionase family DNA binding protein
MLFRVIKIGVGTMQLMSIEDLAAYLGVSKRTIYKYLADGDCPPYIRLSKKNISFDRADVDAWLESKKVIPEGRGTEMQRTNHPWTPRAKQALERAEQEAGRYGLDSVQTEHLLLAVAGIDECLGAIILKNLGVDQMKIRELYERTGKERADAGFTRKPKLSDSSNMAIRHACEESIRLGHTYVGAEHLLAGVLLLGEGLAHGILTQLGVTIDRVRQETAKLVVCRPAPTQQ